MSYYVIFDLSDCLIYLNQILLYLYSLLIGPQSREPILVKTSSLPLLTFLTSPMSPFPSPCSFLLPDHYYFSVQSTRFFLSFGIIAECFGSVFGTLQV